MCHTEYDVVAQVYHARHLVLRAEARSIRRWRHLEDSDAAGASWQRSCKVNADGLPRVEDARESHRTSADGGLREDVEGDQRALVQAYRVAAHIGNLHELTTARCRLIVAYQRVELTACDSRLPPSKPWLPKVS